MSDCCRDVAECEHMRARDLEPCGPRAWCRAMRDAILNDKVQRPHAFERGAKGDWLFQLGKRLHRCPWCRQSLDAATSSLPIERKEQ
jgi:hypothetical protein